MGRDIKFRIWDGEKYLSPYDDGYNFKVEANPQEPLECIRRFLGEFDSECDFEIEQYTGLKDRNGVEIYEGDIVKESSHDVEAEVIYDSRSANYKLAAGDSLSFYLEQCAFFEVIGNIHEGVF